MTIELLTLPDGRALEVFTSGPEGGVPFLYFHGTPGGATPQRFLEREVTGRGLRFIGFSRAGYGDSTPNPGRTVADVVPDAAAVLEHLGAERPLVAGWSGGGPHAIACAAALPGVRAALVIAGVGPHSAADLDFFAGMGIDNLEEYGAARQGEASLRGYLDVEAPGIADTDAPGIIAAMATILPAPDRAVLTDEYGEDQAESFKQALRHGIEGWLEDDLAFIDPWGVDLADITVPVQLWQGELDKMVPAEHAAWLGAHVPGARLRVIPGEGHLSLVLGGIGRMLDDLIRAR